MIDELIVVGARLNSSRLPKKHLLPLAGVPLIECVFKRLSESKRNPTLVLATTSDEFNRPLVTWAERFGVDVYVYDGDVNDLVGRVDSVVDYYQPKRIVYVCGDCPLVDPVFIDTLFSALAKNPNLEGVAVDPEFAGELIHEGILPFSYEGWKKIERLSVSDLHREHVALVNFENNFLKVDYVDVDRRFCFKHRVSVDTTADYRFMDTVYRRWYQNNSLDSIVDLLWLKNQLVIAPELKAINLHVMQKSGYKKYERIHFVCEASSEKGIGQLRRMVQLAQRLQEETGLGTEILVLGEEVPLSWLKFCQLRWFVCELELCNYIEEKVNSLLVADLFPQRLMFPLRWGELFETLKTKNTKLLGIDQMYQCPESFDAVVVPTLKYQGDEFKGLYSGSEYLFVEKESRKDTNETVKTLLVFTGGSDAFGYGKTLPGKLDLQLPDDVQIKWVQGPYSLPPKLPVHPRLNWMVEQSPDEMTALMKGCYAAISVYGNTLFELMSLGIPCGVLPTQGLVTELELGVLVDNNVALLLSADDDMANFSELLSNTRARHRLVENLTNFNIGGGVGRVVNIIAKLLDE